MALAIEETYIQFADPIVAEICATSFGDGDGVTKRMAGKVTTNQFKAAFADSAERTSITSFDEFKYFTRVRESGVWTNCALLTSITLPRSCRSIEYAAFENCSSLSRINLENIETMRMRCFRSCTNLRIEINVPNLLNISQTIGLESEEFRFAGITKVTNLGTVRNLGNYNFFAECPNLTEIWLPRTIVTIARGSMYGCNALTTLVVLATNPPALDSGGQFPTIGGAPERKIYVPYSSDHSILNAYKAAEVWVDYGDAIYELNPDGTVPTT